MDPITSIVVPIPLPALAAAVLVVISLVGPGGLVISAGTVDVNAHFARSKLQMPPPTEVAATVKFALAKVPVSPELMNKFPVVLI